jgi:hypothetical protein
MKPLVTLHLADAQELCNFVVFAPDWLPPGCQIEKTTLRPEQPPGRPEGINVADFGQTPWSAGNPCSLRTLIRGGSRAVRVKQFLYDWAPSAAGIASLWESPTATPFPCQGAVGWLGTDYHKTLGECVAFARTTIEVAVVEGDFEPAELQALMSRMRIADPKAAVAVQAMPFHKLNYWVHYRVPPYRVPYGLWKYPHKRLYDRSRRIALSDLPGLTGTRALLPSTQDIVLDSLLHLEDTGAGHHEIEVIARRAVDANDMIWMTGMSAGSEHAIPLPPTEEEERSAEVHKSVSSRGTTVWLAALTERFGAWEALWEEEQFRYAVWFGASQYWSEERVLHFVESLSMVGQGSPGAVQAGA